MIHRPQMITRTGASDRPIGHRPACICGWRGRKYGLGMAEAIRRDFRRHLERVGAHQ